MEDYTSAAFRAGSEGPIAQSETAWTKHIAVPLQVKNSLDWWKNQLSVFAGIPSICPAPTITDNGCITARLRSTPQNPCNSRQMVTSGNCFPYQPVGTQGNQECLPSVLTPHQVQLNWDHDGQCGLHVLDQQIGRSKIPPPCVPEL